MLATREIIWPVLFRSCPRFDISFHVRTPSEFTVNQLPIAPVCGYLFIHRAARRYYYCFYIGEQ